MKKLSVLVLCAFTLIAASGFAGQYFQDFSAYSTGTTTFSDGSTLYSDHLGTVAAVTDSNYQELALTASGTASTRSAFLLPDLDPGKAVYGFSAKWNSQIYGNFPNAADGFSFTFGQVGSLALASSSYAQEDGYGTGICLSVKTYPGGTPGFYLKVNGNTIASQTYDATARWGTLNGSRHFFEVDWNYAYGVSVRIDGQTIFTNVPTPGITFQSGNRFAWGARCGASTEEVRLDNIVVVTGGNLVDAAANGPFFADTNMVQSAANAFDGNLNTVWEDYNSLASPLGYVGASMTPGSVVGAYALVAPYSTGHLAGPQSAPAGWSFQGSNDGTTWTSLGTGAGHFRDALETRCWLANNSTLYSAYRLNVTAPNGYVGLGLAELKFFAFKPVSAPEGWFQSPVPPVSVTWAGITSSADGTRLAAADDGDIYLSTDGGNSWTKSSAPNRGYAQLCSSWDGKVIMAAALDGVVVSTNFGASWFQPPIGGGPWVASSCSSNASTILVSSGNANSDPAINISTNFGVSWYRSIGNSGNANNIYGWNALASSADGKRLTAGTFGGFDRFGGGIYVSTNRGTNWSRTPAQYDALWEGVSSSADGTKLVGATSQPLYYSTDSGSTWHMGNLSQDGWYCVAASSDGSAVVTSGADGTFLSSDFGASWSKTLDNSFKAVTSSSDGRHLAGIAFDGTVWIYSSVTPSLPVATTVAANSQRMTSAQLNGRGVANYLPASIWFQYGLTTAYGKATPPQSIGMGTNVVGVSAVIGGLAPQTTYHYRAVALNSFGTNFGADLTFTTAGTNAFFDIIQPGDLAMGSSANWPNAQSPSMGIDGNVTTKYLNFDKTNAGLTVYPSVTNVPVTALGLISAEDAPERDPSSFALYGSHDGTNFTLIASNTIPPFLDRQAVQSVSFANTNAYVAYTIIFPTVIDPTNANSIQISEVQLLPYGDITSPNDAITLTLPAGATIASGGGPASALLNRLLASDGNKLVLLTDSNSCTALIKPALGPTIVKGVELIGGYDDAAYPEREPSSFMLEGSNDGTNFTTIGSFNPARPGGNMLTQDYSFLGNTNSYTQYRATFGVPQSGDILQVGEMRLFGAATPVPLLNIATGGGNQLVLRWQNDYVGSFVEFSTNLNSSVWTSNRTLPTLSGGSYSVTFTPTNRSTFFRLHRP